MGLNKMDTQERIITELEHEIAELKRENAYLKQLVPTGDNAKLIEDIMHQYRDAIAEMNTIKGKYKTAVDEIETLKKTYKNNMDKLLSRIKKGK